MGQIRAQCEESRHVLREAILFSSNNFNVFLFFPSGRVIVATSKGVYILVPLPLEKQIQDLLANRRVEEALVLAKGARRNIPKEKFQVGNFWSRESMPVSTNTQL